MPDAHFVNIGPGGTFKPSGAVKSTPADVDAILAAIRDAETHKLAIHFHGGLVKEAKGLALAERIRPVYEAGGAYPLTVVWETGVVETTKQALRELNDTKLFNKLVDYAIRHAAKWLGAAVGARGPGELMPLDEVAAVRASDAEMTQMDVRAKGPGGVQTDEDVAAAEPEIEAELQLDLESDREIEALFDTDAPGEKGLVSAVTAAKLLTQIVAATLRRFTSGRDHGVIPTVVEEVLRAVYLAQLGVVLWGEMKANAKAMFDERDDAAGSYLLAGLAQLQEDRPDLQIDLIGHSAGSIAISHLFEAAATRHPSWKVRNLILLAPAASADVFTRGIIANEDRFASFRMFTMEDAVECQDHLVPRVYPRSLLYLIAGILDGDADSPVVGLRRHTSGEKPYDAAPFIAVSQFLAKPENRIVLSRSAADAGPGLRTSSGRHGDFDDDDETLKSLTAIVGA